MVVDYGCGIGRVTQALAEDGSTVLAVDRSPEMRNHARRYISKRFFEEGAVELLSDADFLSRLPSLRRSVDTLLFMEVLQHIPEPIIDDLLPQLANVLKSTGRIFVFGNKQLDVGADGGVFPTTPTVESVLRRHTTVLRSDVWEDGFSAVRFSYTCASRDS